VRWGRENCIVVFILVHSITKLHPVYQDNLSLVSTIFKSFTNHTLRLHLWTKKHTKFSTHKILDTHPVRITLTDLKSHHANQPEAQEHPNLMVVVPSQPYMCSSSYSQAKMPPRSSNHELQLCIGERERKRKRVFQRRMTKFRDQKLRFAPLLSKHSLYSLV